MRFYSISDIKVNDTSIGNSPYVDFSRIPDGGTLAIILAKESTKTVTFTTNNPGGVSLYNSTNYSTLYFNESGSMTIEIEPNATINVNVSYEYQIDSITIDGTPYSGTSINASQLSNGGTVVITTKEKEASVYYVVGNPDEVSFTMDGTTFDKSNIVDGKWTIKTANPYAYLSISAADGYVITSIMKEPAGGNKEELLSSYSKYKQSTSQYLNGFTSGTTLYISCATLESVRTAHFSVEVIDGDASQIKVARNGNDVPESEFANVAYIPDVEMPISVGPSSYSKLLYKVTINDVEQPAPSYGNTYYFYTLEENAVIKVWPDFPDVDVPVNISFTDPTTKGAVRNVIVNGQIIPAEEWQAEGWTVKLGSQISLSFKSDDYTISSVTMNGQSMSTYSFEASVTTEEPIDIVITASKIKGYDVTVYFEAGTIKIFRGYGENDPVEIPEGADEVTFEVSPSNNMVYFYATDGYKITDIEDLNNTKYPYGYVPVYSDMEIIVNTESFKRDNDLVVYVEGGVNWYSSEVILSQSDNLLRKSVAVNPGYNFVQYAAQDCPLGFSFYPVSDIYLNGELIENVYGSYPATENLASGSVLKVFTQETEVKNYTLNITIAENIAVNILADYVTPVEGPVASVFGPTDIEFTPVTRASELPFIVKVDDVEVTPNEEGKVIAHINADATIAVEANPASSITEINADSNDTAIYNLQGVRVSNPRKGIFIKNGKKIIL